MLILAAKRAGIDAEALDEYSDGEGLWLKGERTPDNNQFWNPLNNDGDAFRLACTAEVEFFWADRSGCSAEEARRHIVRMAAGYDE